MIVAILAALGSALLVAAASVLQHRAGATAKQPTLRSSLRHPLWWAGALSGVSGFGLHVVALSSGALSIVQPLLVCGLLFALPMSHALDRRALRLADLAAAPAVVGGLVIFQLTAQPSTGRSIADGSSLAWCLALTSAVAGAAVVVAIRRRRTRATWLGLCTGLAYGLSAALVKTTVGVIAAHGPAVLSSWPLYAFLVVVLAAITVNQLAFNAGPLALSLPLITIVDPIVSVVVGAAAFGETVSTDPLLLLGQVLGFTVMSAGVVGLARGAAPHAVAIGGEAAPGGTARRDEGNSGAATPHGASLSSSA